MITLFPEEEQVIAQAVEARRREYARRCGVVPGLAFSRLGYAPVPILSG